MWRLYGLNQTSRINSPGWGGLYILICDSLQKWVGVSGNPVNPNPQEYWRYLELLIEIKLFAMNRMNPGNVSGLIDFYSPLYSKDFIRSEIFYLVVKHATHFFL